MDGRLRQDRCGPCTEQPLTIALSHKNDLREEDEKMNLDVKISRKEEGYFVVSLDGRLDSETYAFCEEKLTPILNAATRGLTFDMSGLSYISSMGLRVVIKTRKAIEGAGGKVLMVHLQPQIAKIFEIAAALPRYQVFASIREADEYFTAMQEKTIEEQKNKPER
jgi:anti-anti-sigma factor